MLNKASCFYISLLAASLAGCGSPSFRASHAQVKVDVTPRGELGKLILTGLETLPPGASLQISTRQRDVKVSSAGLNKAYLLNEGEYCVSILGPTRQRRCGFQVSARQDRVVQLSTLTMHWNESITHADFGQKIHFSLMDEESETASKTILEFADSKFEGKYPSPVLVFPGTLTLSWGVSALASQAATKVVTPAAANSFDLTPPDLRATLRVHAQPSRYPFPKQGAYVTNLAAFLHVEKRPSQDLELKGNLFNNKFSEHSRFGEGIGSFARIPLQAQKEVDLFYKVWPLPKDGSSGLYGLVLNHIFYPVQVEPEETPTFHLEAINVNHVNGVTPGCYQMSQVNPFQDGKTEVRPFYYFGQGYQLASSIDNCFSTETSLFVLPGWTYKVAAFLTDSSNNRIPQSVDIVEL